MVNLPLVKLCWLCLITSFSCLCFNIASRRIYCSIFPGTEVHRLVVSRIFLPTLLKYGSEVSLFLSHQGFHLIAVMESDLASTSASSFGTLPCMSIRPRRLVHMQFYHSLELFASHGSGFAPSACA